MKLFTATLSALMLLAPSAAFATPVAVPEPATLSLLAVGAIGAAVAARFRGKK